LYCLVYAHFVGVVHYYRLKVFENRVIRKLFRLKERRSDRTEDISYTVCTRSRILFQ
jgi:hypothetical protein